MLNKPLGAVLLLLLAGFMCACKPESIRSESLDTQAVFAPQPDDLILPPGFQATVFAEGVGAARHMAIRHNGDVYLRLSKSTPEGCIAVLRDADHDGKAEQKAYFHTEDCGTGIEIQGDWLYFSSQERVYRQALPDNDSLLPTVSPEVLIENLGTARGHTARSLALDGKGNLYVNLGAPSNACQKRDRIAGSPGQDPCPLLEEYAGIYRFAIDKPGQDKLRDGYRYATGIRNAVALAWHPGFERLYLAQHGRDQLHSLFPELYSEQDNADLPAEEFAAIVDGANLGWPYCYYDGRQNKKILSPEYGGDGVLSERCKDFTLPLIAFPAHYAPNDLLFYTGKQFPEKYHNGAFIAFHGSWNRSPLEQEGFQVVFAPANAAQSFDTWDIFADGFARPKPIRNPGQARYRPMSLAQHPDGSLLVADSKGGRVWKISHSSTN